MKKNVFIMMLLFIVSGFSVDLAAQESIDALLKKCETIPSVEMTVIKEQNQQTKKLENRTVNLVICENPELVNEFVTAFRAIVEKDSEKVKRVIENRKGGQIVNFTYELEDIRYIISQGKGGCATIAIMKRLLLNGLTPESFEQAQKLLFGIRNDDISK